MFKPRISTEPLYLLLRDGKIKEFNQRRAKGETCDFIACDFRTVDLRGIDARGLDMSHCYFRQADLRGVDFIETFMDGASINQAQISGARFPKELSAGEISLSLEQGTRMRYQHSS